MTENHPLPKVTIMIPTFNQENYIEEAIKSALMQNYPNLEIIIGDDCSTDRTGEIAKRYVSEKVIYFRNEKNLGRVGNYHHIAHDLATGEWAINLDGDDYFTDSSFITNAITNIRNVEKKGKNVVAYCYKNPKIDKYDKEYDTIRINENSILMEGKTYFLNYYNIRTFSHPSIIFNLPKGKEIQLYTIPHQASDFHSLIRLFIIGNIILDKREISYWRVHGNNTTIIESEDKQKQAIQTFNEIETFAKSFCSEDEIHTWKKNMIKYAYKDYVNTYVTTHRNFRTFLFLIRYPKFTKRYFANWFHFIWGRSK